MKVRLKPVLIAMCLMLTLILNPSIVQAEVEEYNNLKVKFDVVQLEDSNDVKAVVKVTNMGIRPVDNIKVTGTIPTGMKVKEGSVLTKEVITLGVGESTTHEFYCTIDKKVVVNPGDNNSNGGNKPSVDVNVGLNKPNTDGSLSNGDKVETGDNNIIFTSVIIILVCIALIAILAITKKKNAKKVLSLFLCFLISGSLFSNVIAAKADDNMKREITVKKNLNVEGKDYEIGVVVSYADDSNDVETTGEVLTRGKWISELVTALGLKENSDINWDEDIDNPFNDIEGHMYEEDILYAYVYSLVDFEGDTFRPDEPATREFAAVTSVKGLGFQATNDIVCEDSSEITYLKEIEVAVAMNIINLDNNKFYPLRELTESEAVYIIDGVKGILNSEKLEDNYDNNIVFNDGVIELSDNVSYEINGSTITFEGSEEVSMLSKDDIFILPDMTPYKVTNVTIDNNNVIVETVLPEMEETLDYVDVQGVAEADMSKFIPAEGISVVERNQEARLGIDTGGGVDIPGELDLKIKKGDFEGEITVSIPRVEFKADMDLDFLNTKIYNMYFKVFSEVDFSTNIIEYFSEDGTIKIGTLPINIIPGVMVDVGVRLFYDLSGKIVLKFELEGASGIQILNNRPRVIKSINSNFDVPTLEAELKVGPEIFAELLFLNSWNLVDVMINGGLGVNGDVIIRDNGLLCMDANVFLYLDFEALRECKLNEWLELGFSLSIFDEENSPKKYNWHFENVSKVPECTYARGILRGAISEAGEQDSYIKNALVQVYRLPNIVPVAETTSDLNGEYKLELNAGSYYVKINKDGYIPFTATETIQDNEEKFLQTYLLVGQGLPGEKGIAGGKIINAVTGSNISDITLNIRKDWNNTTGDIVTTIKTNSNGQYQVELPLGYYTIQMIKDGYITNTYNIYVKSGSALNQNTTLVPNTIEMPSGDLRVVLTWGEQPGDLDSHMTGPTADGNDKFHIYFEDKSYFKDGIKYADLDRDDTSSYGPETTTVYNINSSGKYNFYVHDYTNRNNNFSVAMSNSGAKVEVYKGETLYATYNIPTNRVGNYWHVFEYDSATNLIKPINEFVDGVTLSNSNEVRQQMNLWEVEEKDEIIETELEEKQAS